MAWYNPSTWTPVDAVQNKVGQFGKAASSFQGSSGTQAVFGNPSGASPGGNAPSPQAAGGGGKVLGDMHPDGPPTINTGGSGVSAADQQQADLARMQIDQGLQGFNSSLDRIDPQLNTAIGNINNDYTTAFNTLTGQRHKVERDYKTNTDQQLQDYQGARDNNDMNARNLLLGARRLIGSTGAGGGSADLYGAPLAAQTEGNNANAVVKQTNERNLSTLGTAYDDNKDKIANSINDIGRQRDVSTNDTRSQFESQRADILNNIAALTGQRAILNGNNYQAATAAAAPFMSRINGILNNIDTLAARPTGVQTPNVTLSTPDLAQYNLGRFDAPAVAQQDPTLYQNPSTRVLLGLDPNQDQRQQQQQQQLV